MSGLSNYVVAQTLDTWFDTGTVYVALYSSDPGNAGTGGTDVTSTIRVAGRVLASFPASSSRSIANDVAVSFGTAAAGASVTHFGLWSASTSGNFLAGAAVTTPRTVVTGDTVSFAIGALSISLP